MSKHNHTFYIDVDRLSFDEGKLGIIKLSELRAILALSPTLDLVFYSSRPWWCRPLPFVIRDWLTDQLAAHYHADSPMPRDQGHEAQMEQLNIDKAWHLVSQWRVRWSVPRQARKSSRSDCNPEAA